MSNNKQESNVLQVNDATCYTSGRDVLSYTEEFLIKQIESMSYCELASLNYAIAKSKQQERVTLDQSKIANVIGASRWNANVAMGKLHAKKLVNKTYRYKLPCHYTIHSFLGMIKYANSYNTFFLLYG